MSPLPHGRAAPRIVVDLQPHLLAELLRRMLADRGVVALESRTAGDEPLDLALVAGTAPGTFEAAVTVRLADAGWTLPAEAVIQAIDPVRSRVVEVSDVDQLAELLMGLVAG